MKLESIKILVSEIDYKLGRIEFFKERLEKWENKEDKEYEQSLRRLNKLVDEASNLLQIMKLEELDNFKEYEEIAKKLEKNTPSESDDESLDAFNKIKSGEASRMGQKS